MMYHVQLTIVSLLLCSYCISENPEICRGENSNKLNERCADEKDCDLWLRCLNGVCKCKEGAIEVNTTMYGPGSEIPTFGNLCDGMCYKYLKCVNGKCECPEGLRLRYGKCFKECEENEFFDEKSLTCKAECDENEVKVNGTCLPYVNLGVECKADRQCHAGFSWCQSGICVCKSGFTQQGKTCQTESYSCPNGGEPFVDQNGELIKCDRNDDCPDKFNCVFYSEHYIYRGGHCCPKVSRCPIGEPHPTASCEWVTKSEECPETTHSCISTSNYGDIETRLSNKVCCPKACFDDGDSYSVPLTLWKGKCYKQVKLGKSCLWDGQCSRYGWSGAVCKEGICQCGENAVFVPENESCFLRCDVNEFREDSTCYPRLKIGDICSESKACPYGAKCKSGICQCRCNHRQYGDQFCASELSLNCPHFSPLTTKVNEEKGVFCMGKYTGVRAGYDDGAVKVVEKCPKDHFCQYQIFGMVNLSNLGFCCPKPVPQCPNGNEPMSLNCDTNDTQTCIGGYCHKTEYHVNEFGDPYSVPIPERDNEVFICCRNDESDPDEPEVPEEQGIIEKLTEFVASNFEILKDKFSSLFSNYLQ